MLLIVLAVIVLVAAIVSGFFGVVFVGDSSVAKPYQIFALASFLLSLALFVAAAVRVALRATRRPPPRPPSK